MQSEANQEPFDELQASAPDAIDGDTSRTDEHADRTQELSPALIEIERLLLEIADRAKSQQIRRARPIETSTLSTQLYFELPPPVKYPRKSKGKAVPSRCVK
jgi:hypothetical protein